MKFYWQMLCVFAFCLFGCSWTTTGAPGPAISSNPKMIPTDTSLGLRITPDGVSIEKEYQPDQLEWTETCKLHADTRATCLVAWADNEIKIKRPRPIHAAFEGNRISSYFLVRDEQGRVHDMEGLTKNMDLFDRRLWIEETDLQALAEHRVPNHAMPIGDFASGITPRGQLPEMMFRVGISYNLDCLQRLGEVPYPLGALRAQGHVARISGRFVSWDPRQETLQQMRQISRQMARDPSADWQRMELSWHKPQGRNAWISDSVVMLSTEDWLTFRRPMETYTQEMNGFRNHNGRLFKLGEWLQRNNVAPFYLQSIFPRLPDDEEGRAYWTVPTIRPRIQRLNGAIFVPLNAEILIDARNKDTGEKETVSLGCIPFEQRGFTGDITRQLLHAGKTTS